jgi:hypothetical protein
MLSVRALISKQFRERHNSMGLTQEVVRFVTGTRYEDIPSEVVGLARFCARPRGRAEQAVDLVSSLETLSTLQPLLKALAGNPRSKARKKQAGRKR